MSKDLMFRLAIQRMGFLKTSEKLKVMSYCRRANTLPERDTLREIIGRSVRSEYSIDRIFSEVEEDLSFMLKSGSYILSVEDDDYPQRLKEIHNPPFLLYCRGERLKGDALNISVVGTRKASGRALDKSFALSFELARCGAAVTSGLAAGIDSSAHKGALAGKGYTVAVFGCGIDRIYPSSNRGLASAILDGGGTLISEFPPDTAPMKYNFPERNRIVSGLSEAVVIVESPLRSGALITADFALEQGRDVYVLKTESPSGSAGAGTDSLIEDGAVPVEGAAGIFANLSYRYDPPAPRFSIEEKSGSAETGRFLAERLMAELMEREYGREGVYYSL